MLRTPMRIALMSDIHGNLEAFQVVLEDIRRENVTEIICLGDIVGYGGGTESVQTRRR